MEIIRDNHKLREVITSWRRQGETIGFVPTMGYLHRGHLSLIEIASQKATKKIASIFVNPAQFNDPEDLKKYPVDLPRDFELLSSVGTDAVYVPTPELIYESNFQSWVELTEIPLGFEGASRAGHFKGVSTVVAILFNLVQPDVAIFGEKDFQQLRIIETMVQQLKFNIEIVRGPTLREEDGLAMSSRNVRLSAEARKIAPEIYKSLQLISALAKDGEQQATKLIDKALKHLSGFPEIQIDYLALIDQKTFKEVATVDSQNRLQSRIIFAGILDGIRLIDNISLGG